MSFSAWGDESGSHAAKDPGVYLMAAAIGEADDVEHLRSTMRDLRLPSSGPKLHWKDESAARRMTVAEAIAQLPIDGFVVVRVGPQADRPERRRRKCLERLLHELTALGCDHVILESRGTADDRRDRALLDSLRRSKSLVEQLRMSHRAGPADPALWIADALCGAVVQDRIGEPSYLKTLARRVTVEVIDAT